MQLRTLDNDAETVVCAGITPTTLLQVLFSSAARECASKHTCGCDLCDLVEVTIPNSVTVIQEGAFEFCGSLQRVNIPDSVTRIEEGAFAACPCLLSVTLPESVTEIGSGAFARCRSLEHIRIPSALVLNRTLRQQFVGYVD